MSAEFLCNRWTIIILRELLFGSTNFNDISRGVPRMSRTLLSHRLKEMTEIGLLTRHEKLTGKHVDYKLTDAGKALKNVVVSMACWGQEWLEIEPSINNIDVNLLMWDIHRNINPLPELPDPFVVQFFLTDVPENKSSHWLVLENGEVDLCHVDHALKVDVKIIVSAKKLTAVWMGWEDFGHAIKESSLQIIGAEKYTKIASLWLGQSTIAHLKKRPKALRVNGG
ncbi:helix-turn-helix transcriptional regulator [Colwellia hornerae]|uniref:Helix-turn-helix transcriptional regulator n=2 Tax=Colwellia hornerae TaxID=89402 RepID=A0A5C6Q329_9GAMM|nr:helix-turn-helix transcriptional regulator [Colwellia hornerae]TWX54354.1 helix-turn-helix transcriptional regulator [Colwellia hornerae]TWX63244.1 helix-turn-helix transcriptional regulator [Colwellia hornerae]